jgi:hypothetical protein
MGLQTKYLNTIAENNDKLIFTYNNQKYFDYSKDLFAQ